METMSEESSRPSLGPKSTVMGPCNPNDRIEAPIIACNHSLPASNRMRRPSTPSSKVGKSSCGAVGANSNNLSGIDRVGRKGRDDKNQGPRIRSASAGRDIKSEMCSRYWSYLFENLERSISEIYEGCEKEENIRQCKEVLLFLDNYTRDFKNLIQWFNVKWNYEKTSPPMRPTALAWEIRKPTLCLLPHTLAYEKLVGLKKEGSNRSEKDSRNARMDILEPIIGLSSNLSSSAPKECVVHGGKTSVALDADHSNHNDNNDEVSNNNIVKNVENVNNLDDVCHGSPKSVSVAPTEPFVSFTNNKNNPVNVDPSAATTSGTVESVITVEIGLQTDFEEDPDIWYFPGGRVVASQTDYSEEYGPLTIPVSNFNNSSPVILILDTSDSDMESSLIDTVPSVVVATGMETCPSSPKIITSTPPPLCDRDAGSGDASGSLKSEKITTETINSIKRPSTPLGGGGVGGTKSSATQLSAGVLIDETSPLGVQSTANENSTKGKDDGGTLAVGDSANKGNTPAGSGAGPSPTAVKSTFLEKAKTGMLRHSQSQAKSVSSYLNKIGVPKSAPSSGTNSANFQQQQMNSQGKSKMIMMKSATASLGGGQSGGLSRGQKVKVPSIPNYRSNIASRCRTAVNTTGGHLPPLALPQQCSKNPGKNVSGSASTSAAPTIPNSGSLAGGLIRAITSGASDSGVSGSTTDTADAVVGGAVDSLNGIVILCAEKEKVGESIIQCNTNTLVVGVANSGGKGPISQSRVETNKQKQKKWKGQQHQKAPMQQGGGGSKGGGISRSKSMINPIIIGKDDNNDSSYNDGGRRGPGYHKRLNSNSYISLPDESRRKTAVDEDGWETVKARSSRSKWSSSNSSLASSSNVNQSRSSLDKGFVVPPNLNEVGPGSQGQGEQRKSLGHTGEGLNNRKRESSNNSFKLKNNGDKRNSDSLRNINNSNNNDKVLLPNLPKIPVSNSKGDIIIGGKGTSVDDEVDDEEIKKKEADLDDAIREEELLEQELLQVEKDFERIEKDRTEDSTITDSEHATSPEVVDVDIDLENEHFFFVSMDDEEAARMEELPPREAGRILSLREKLMSPAKKCDGAERLKRYEAKLAKAERNREKLLQSKFNRYVELSDRFEALNETTKKLVAERAELIVKSEERRRRAGEKRQQYLKSIRRKAHDEDSKAKEIAFINLLEAQNKRHDYFASAQEAEDRLQMIQEERRVKLEERSGKASGVIQRQSHIKKDWQAKLEDFQEKRRKADERIRREKEEKAKERTEMAIEKAKDREVRMSALNAAKQAEKEELEKKIRRKQEDTARRHEENMEQIRQKAMEFSAPRIQEDSAVPSSLRICTLCKIIMQSEVQELGHLRGRAHLEAVKKMETVSISGGGDTISSLTTALSPPLSHSHSHLMNGLESFGLKFIADVQPEKMDGKIQPDRNRQKAAKKHSKKLLQKLMTSGLEFEKLEKEIRDAGSSGSGFPDSTLLTKTRRNLLELGRLVNLFEQNKGSSSAATTMDRLMADIRRAAVKTEYLKEWIVWMNGVAIAQKVLECTATDLPIKLKVTACEMLQGFVLGNLKNGLYILRGTAVCTIINLCAQQWNCLIPDDNRWLCGSPMGLNELPTDPLIEALVALLFNLLGNVPDPFHGVMKKGSSIDAISIQNIKNRTHDIIAYLVGSSVIDRISVYCGGVRGPVDSQPGVASLLQIFMDFLVVLVYALQFCWGVDPTGCIMNKKEPDSSQLLATLEASELGGAVSMSYSLLLHQGAPSRPRTGLPHSIPPPPAEKTAQVVKSTLCLINAMARLDLIALQNVLGSEAVSLQFRHIASQLLWQVVPHRESYSMRRLLTELIIALGNFTVGNKDNQRTIQSGQTPTVLQMLCTLPQEYFTESKYSHNFFPTLLAATHGSPENSKVLLQNNIHVQKLEEHAYSEEGKKNVIVKRLLCVTTAPTTKTTLKINDETTTAGALPMGKKSLKGKGKKLKIKKKDEKEVTTIPQEAKRPLEEQNS